MPSVADALNLTTKDSFGDLLAEMSQNSAVGGLPIRVASILMQAGDREFGSLLNEVRRSLKWATHPMMRKHLSTSDISLTELLDGKTSIFVCLPIDEMEMAKQIRWMRVILNLGISLIMKAEMKPKERILFVADEFPALGSFPKIVKSFRELRSANIKILACSQGTKELAALYPVDWHSLVNNSVVQILGINCEPTAKWVSEVVGKFRSKQKDSSEKMIDLMSTAEVLRFLGKEAANQIIIPTHGPPMLLKSVHWYRSRHSYRNSRVLKRCMSFGARLIKCITLSFIRQLSRIASLIRKVLVCLKSISLFKRSC